MQHFLVGLSILFQLVAAILALRLIRITGKHRAWMCISAALVFMAVRRGLTLTDALTRGSTGSFDLQTDCVTLATSILMVMGIYWIGPLFAAIQEAKEFLARLSVELEQKVADRTWQLRETEQALLQSYHELEQGVKERTAELAEANSQLQREILERRRAEDALAAEKEHLAVTLRSIGDGVITTDIEGRVVLINSRAEELTGWTQEQAAGKKLRSVFNIINEKTREPCQDPVSLVISTGQIVNLTNHTALIARDNRERIIADSGAPIRGKDGTIIGVVLVFRDMTENRKREEEIRRVEKLESIGLLAAGIAHDFNNILTAILGNVQLAAVHANAQENIVGALNRAEKASLRAKNLAQQLLTFSKGGTPIKEISSTPELVRDCACFALRGSNVRCDFALPADLWPVEVDKGQIGQVIENLIINADQAMPDGGAVMVRAENITIGMECNVRIPVNDGKYVRLSIHDAGCGIPEENRCKIFDPYFTTKLTGSGLGLTTSHSIIKNHDGYIAVESEVGAGTSFHIYLPASTDGPSWNEETPVMPPTGSGRILVMEDEEIIRKVTEELLTLLGYEIQCAADGTQAIELFQRAKECGRPFDAVVMDLTIPGGLGGKPTIKRLLEIDPEVKAIVSSGYSNDPIMSNYRLYGFKGVIPKPYSIDQLSRTLHEVMTWGSDS